MFKKTILLDSSHMARRNKAISESQFGGWFPDAWSYMYLNSLLMLAEKFHPFKEFIICVDDKEYWRKDIYPEYKANRKRENDTAEEKAEWEDYYFTYTQMLFLIMDCLPFRVLVVPKAEADDIIGVIAKESEDSVVIVSSDKDFIQCLRYKDIWKQIDIYDPIKRKYFESKDPERDLIVKCYMGDKGDNIPAIGKRIGIKTAEKMYDEKKELTPEMEKLYKRNTKLISFDYIPEILRTDIKFYFKELLKEKKEFKDDHLFNFFEERKMDSIIDKWPSIKRELERYTN